MKNKGKTKMIDSNIKNIIEKNLPNVENKLNYNFNLFKQSLGRGYDKLSTKLKSLTYFQ